MVGIPKIKSGDWITVGSHDCVVTQIHFGNPVSGDCSVIFNKNSPTSHDVEWDGEKWNFSERLDYGGYVKDSDPFVYQLKKGRYA